MRSDAVPACKTNPAVAFAQEADTTGTLAQALPGLGLLTKATGQLILSNGYLEEECAIARS